MLGAIIGDIVVSRFEFIDDFMRPKDFALFTSYCHPTDDSLMTLAVAEALLLSKEDHERLKKQVIASMKKVANKHPNVVGESDFIGGFLRKVIPNRIIVMETEQVCALALLAGWPIARMRYGYFPKSLQKSRTIIPKGSKAQKPLPWQSILQGSAKVRINFG